MKCLKLKRPYVGISRQEALKMPWPFGRAGATPVRGTRKYFGILNKIFRRSIGISIITKIPMTGEIYQLSFPL